jgi:hypothetical protein
MVTMTITKTIIGRRSIGKKDCSKATFVPNVGKTKVPTGFFLCAVRVIISKEKMPQPVTPAKAGV